MRRPHVSQIGKGDKNTVGQGKNLAGHCRNLHWRRRAQHRRGRSAAAGHPPGPRGQRRLNTVVLAPEIDAVPLSYPPASASAKTAKPPPRTRVSMMDLAFIPATPAAGIRLPGDIPDNAILAGVG